MDLDFSKIIDEIQNEIEFYYLKDCIAWVDKNHDNAWTKSIDRFNKAIDEAFDLKNIQWLKREGEIYKTTCLDFIKKFKEKNQTDESERFFSSLDD